ncbi:MAG: tetratricopeptide repeat protein [Candidatus Eremiobacteraeota bacterium]|nr:tetratricopeptide repeat protein [Candidatus Eremiobacteraeota bacterium]
MPIHTVHADGSERPDSLLFGIPYPPDGYEQLPEGISLCMIVKNEERFLESCLRSVEGIVDEINIVDTGSTDRTLEIAEKFGARIEHREWRNDLAWARNEALKMATRRWTLILDGDEEIAPESRRWLLDLRTVPSYLTVLYTRIHNDTTEHGAVGMMSHSLPRIFPTNPRISYRGVIHETLVVDDGETRATAVITPIRILHRGYTMEIIGAKKKEERNAPLLRRATEIHAEDSFSWFNYGNYLLGSEQYDEGIESLQRVVDMERGKEMRGFVPMAYVFLAGTVATHLKDIDRALTTIDECLDRAPNYVLAIYGKAEILARAGRYEEAREWFKKAIATKATEERYNVVDEELSLWKSQYNIATTFLNEAGREEEAIAWLEEAHRNKPDVWIVVERLAIVLEKVRRYFDAEIVLREAFERHRDAATSITYVNYLARRKRMTRALEVIEEALPSASDDVAAALNVAAAAIVREVGNGDPIPYLKSALDVAPGSGMALAMLDEIYAQQGDELARARLRREEFDAPLQTAADYMRRSSRLLEEHRLEDAASVAEEGAVRFAGDASLVFNLGLALAQLEGKKDRAIEVLAAATKGDPSAIEAAAFMRASLLEKEGRNEAALEVLDAVFGEEPTNEDALLFHARLLESLGQSEAAEAGLRAAMGSGRKRIGVELAAMMLRAGRIAEAGDVASEALATA